MATIFREPLAAIPPIAAKPSVVLLTFLSLSLPSGPLLGPPRVVVNNPDFQTWSQSTCIISSDSFKLPLQTIVPENQYNWPNPRGWPPLHQNLLATDSFQLPLTTVKPPFLQMDWPVPRGPKPLLQDYQDSLNLCIQPVFISQPLSDYRLHSKTVVYTSAYFSNMGLLSPIAVTLPFNQSDWPVPRGPTRSGDLGWISQNILPFSAPFAQDDWPNPRGPTQPAPAWTDRYKLTLIGADLIAGRQRDWPNPRGPQQPAPAWTDSFKLPLTTVEPPFLQQDWPVPRGAARGEGFVQRGLTVAPFNQDDWPNPRGALRPVQDWIEAANVWLIGQDLLPFRQTDWPVPKGYQRSIDLANWINYPSLALTAVPVLPPANVQERVNPRGAQFPIDLRTWTYSYNLNLIGADQLPGNQFYWLTPRGPQFPVDLRTWTWSYNLNLIGADQLPFSQSNWATPRGPQRSVEALTWTQTGYLSQQQTVVPIGQFYWPQPRGRGPAASIDYKANTGSINLPLQPTFLSRAIEGQQVWSKSVTYRTAYGSSLSLLTAPVPRPATFTFDWPNPRGRVIFSDWVRGSSIALLTAPIVRPATFTFDWPNPRGRFVFSDWIQGIPNGQRAFVNTKPGVTNDWQNPTLAVVRRQDFFFVNTLILAAVSPNQPVVSIKVYKRYLGVTTTGQNLALYYAPQPPIPPIPPQPTAKAKRMFTSVTSGDLKTQVTSGRGVTQVTSSGKAKTDVSDP